MPRATKKAKTKAAKPLPVGPASDEAAAVQGLSPTVAVAEAPPAGDSSPAPAFPAEPPEPGPPEPREPEPPEPEPPEPEPREPEPREAGPPELLVQPPPHEQDAGRRSANGPAEETVTGRPPAPPPAQGPGPGLQKPGKRRHERPGKGQPRRLRDQAEPAPEAGAVLGADKDPHRHLAQHCQAPEPC